jgi:hypothetical protein
MPFEQLLPYYRGARFALIAIRRRHPEDAALQEDTAVYIATLERYEKAVIETYRMRRRREPQPES